MRRSIRGSAAHERTTHRCRRTRCRSAARCARTGARFGLAIALLFLALTVARTADRAVRSVPSRTCRTRSPRPPREHWFGADQYGRDTFSRILFGTRTALLAIVDGRWAGAGDRRLARAGRGISRRQGRCADHAPGRCAAGISLSAAGADHRRRARPEPDQFGDRHRHHLYAAICTADARPGADRAGRRFRHRGARRSAPANCA